MLSCSATSLIGKKHWDVYPAAVGTAVEANCRRAMKERVSIAFENYYEPWKRWFDLRVYPARDGGLSIFFQDATERKRSEEALHSLNETSSGRSSNARRSYRKRRRACAPFSKRATPIRACWRWTAPCSMPMPLSLSGIGAKLEDVIGLPFWETPWFSGTLGMPAMVRAAIAGVVCGEVARQEIHVNLPVGGWRWLDFQMRPVRDQQGAGVAIVPEAVEVTERRAAEEAVRHSQKMEAIGQLTGGAVHWVTALSRSSLVASASAARSAYRVRSTYRRHRCGGSSRLLSRSADERMLARHPMKSSATSSTSPVVGERRRYASHGARVPHALTLDIAERPLAVEADANQFETVMVDLASNARDAMEGHGSLTVRLARSPGKEAASGEFVTVAVINSGCGIPPDQIDRIFEPFFTTKEVGRGTGLGLSRLGFVQQSGGKVTVDSAVGVGTTITLNLPLSSKPIQPSKDGPVTSAVSRARGQVLVVEDNAEVGEFSSQLLSDLGYQTVLASNAEEALQLINKEPERFDVVFSDVVMPGLDGVAFGQHIRRRFPHIPFVLTSGFSHVLNGDGNHGFDLLQKPYSVEDLAGVTARPLRAPSTLR